MSNNPGYTMVRGKYQRDRCTQGGFALYCKCGCQEPREGDPAPRLEDVTIEKRPIDGYFDKDPIKLIRNSNVVGHVDYGRSYVFLDGVEYLGVTESSAFSPYMIEALQLLTTGAICYTQPTVVAAQTGDTIEETVMRERISERADLLDQDKQHDGQPGYCKKCHTFCFGDCES